MPNGNYICYNLLADEVNPYSKLAVPKRVLVAEASGWRHVLCGRALKTNSVCDIRTRTIIANGKCDPSLCHGLRKSLNNNSNIASGNNNSKNES